jgi:hypothetical protein
MSRPDSQSTRTHWFILHRELPRCRGEALLVSLLGRGLKKAPPVSSPLLLLPSANFDPPHPHVRKRINHRVATQQEAVVCCPLVGLGPAGLVDRPDLELSRPPSRRAACLALTATPPLRLLPRCLLTQGPHPVRFAPLPPSSPKADGCAGALIDACKCASFPARGCSMRRPPP